MNTALSEMPLIFQSILLVGITSCLLSALLFALTKGMPRLQKGIGWWALSSMAGALGYCALLFYGLTGNPAQGEALYNVSLIFWSSFLLIGSSHWLRKSINTRLVLLTVILTTIWVIYFNFIQPVFLPAAIVTALTCGAFTLYTNWLFSTSGKNRGVQNTVLITVLFISGVHALDYPVLRPHESLAMAGIILCIITSLSINIILASIVITQFKTRMERSEQDAINMAMQDSLTGLKNRLGLIEEFEKKISSAAPKKQMIAFIFADLDDFKSINDTYGHEEGDHVLCTIASRIHAMIRHNDVAVRIGGDEFVILLTDIKADDENRIPRFVNRLIGRIREPITTHQCTHQVEVSIGLAIYPKNGEDLQKLLNSSDTSMYINKKIKKRIYNKVIHLNFSKSHHWDLNHYK